MQRFKNNIIQPQRCFKVADLSHMIPMKFYTNTVVFIMEIWVEWSRKNRRKKLHLFVFSLWIPSWLSLLLCIKYSLYGIFYKQMVNIFFLQSSGVFFYRLNLLKFFEVVEHIIFNPFTFGTLRIIHVYILTIYSLLWSYM